MSQPGVVEAGDPVIAPRHIVKIQLGWKKNWAFIVNIKDTDNAVIHKGFFYPNLL